MHLCQSLARFMPDKRAGGRQGLKVYEVLMDMVSLFSTTVAFIFSYLLLLVWHRQKRSQKNTRGPNVILSNLGKSDIKIWQKLSTR